MALKKYSAVHFEHKIPKMKLRTIVSKRMDSFEFTRLISKLLDHQGKINPIKPLHNRHSKLWTPHKNKETIHDERKKSRI